jgi:hypothetical protein
MISEKSININNNKKIPRFAEYLTLAALFILGLNLAPFSIASIIIILPIILFIIPKNKLYLNKTDILINSLLLGFTTSYFVTLGIYDYVELTRGLRYILAIQTSYLLGHYSFFIFNQKNTETTILKPIIFLALGFSVFTITATIMKSIKVNLFFFNHRYIYVPWSKSTLYSTILAAFSSLGISLLPVAIKLSFFSNKKENNIFMISTIYLMTIGGLMSSLMFSNRSSFCMLIYIALILILCKAQNISWVKFAVILSFLLIIIYIFTLTDLSILNQFDIPVLKRFAENNLGNTRFELWKIGLQHLTTDLWGGKPYPLVVHTLNNFRSYSYLSEMSLLNPSYYQQIYWETSMFSLVHNLWLDIHYQTGIIPFCLLIIFQLAHLKSLSLLIFKKKGIVSITCICLFLAYILYFMIEPIMPMTIRFFMASCFSLAYFRQISKSTFTTSDLTRKNSTIL